MGSCAPSSCDLVGVLLITHPSGLSGSTPFLRSSQFDVAKQTPQVLIPIGKGVIRHPLPLEPDCRRSVPLGMSLFYPSPGR